MIRWQEYTVILKRDNIITIFELLLIFYLKDNRENDIKISIWRELYKFKVL